MPTSPSARLSSLKRWLVGRAVMGVARLVRSLPDAASSGFGAALGDALYRASPGFRGVARTNLRQAFGSEWTEAQIRRAMKETFRNIGKSAFEFLRMPALTAADVRRLVAYEGRQNLDEARSHGKGCLLVTAHFGNWEIMAARLAADGYPLSVVARDADDPETNRLINSIRESCGYQVLSRDRSIKPMLQALRRNELVGILVDQNYTDGIFVPFFDRLAATATGPAAIARATGAAIVPCFCIRQPDNSHRALFMPALDVAFSDDKEADLYRVTAAITRAIEEAVRAYPTQWLWIHNRWKRRPPEEQPGAPREVIA